MMTINNHQPSEPAAPGSSRHQGRRSTLLAAAVLVLATAAVFWPAVGHEFLAYDDSVDVYKNPYLQARSLDNLLHFWRYPYEGLYTPLTYTLYALAAWSPALLAAETSPAVVPDPRLFHGLNLLLHLASVLLVWRILILLLGRARLGEAAPQGAGGLVPVHWAAWAGALLFAVHPLQVEPVAWVAGFKDVLFGLLALGAVGLYLKYLDVIRRQASGRTMRARLFYGLGTVVFVLALLAKPTAVVVPLVVWLLAVWGWRCPGRKQLAPLAIWAIMALAWGILTRWVQPGTALVFEPPLWARPLIAGDAVFFYLAKLIFPIQFGPDYGRSPQFVLQGGRLFLTGLVLLVPAVWLWVKRKQAAWPAAAAGVFVAGLLPVLGLISFSFQRHSTVADRYVYLAMLGPALALAWGLTRTRKKAAAACAAIVLALFLVRSARQVPLWHDTVTLFNHALRVNPDSFLGHNNLGFALAQRGQDAEAISHFNEALRIEPEAAITHLNLGSALERQGDLAAATAHYQEALRIVPTYARAHTYLGLVLAKQGHYDEALAHHQQALSIEPGFAEAHNNLANVLARQGKFDQAGEHYMAALRLNPGDAKARANFGISLAMQKRFDEALLQLAEAIRLEPESANAHANLAGVYLQQMKLEEAERHYAEAVRLNPRYKNAHLRLSTVLAARGDFERARHHASEVLRLDPDNQAARRVLERIEYLDRSSN